LVGGVTRGTLPDYQAASLLMAILLRGMNGEETAQLTEAMVRSGVRVRFSNLPSIPVDKHSTGGVGDKTSLILAPLAIACGAIVPMMSGRGLGHTGGTLDKLESIPGFRTPLISASIMSKKIAEGIGGLILDVKTGRGAFMKTLDDSRRLAESLVAIGNASEVRTEALITRMDTPLGRAVGNANEVIESIETLKGRGPRDLEQLSVILAARMLVLAGVTRVAADAERRIRQALADGTGVEAFRRIIQHQGGDAAVIDDYSRLPSAPDEHRIVAGRHGVVVDIEAERVGRAAVSLGAGRSTLDDAIDHGVGITVVAPPGSSVKAGDAVLLVHHRRGRGLDEALTLLADAVTVDDGPYVAPPLIVDEIA
jgi:thymidine phosphorylase